MEQEKKSFFELLSKTQAFVLGTVGAFLVLCTIGFFLLLAVMLSGDKVFIGSSETNGDDGFVGPKKFSECLDSGKMAAKVSADGQLGASLGVQGTPALFVNGYFIAGAYPYEAIKIVLDAVLAGQTPKWDEANYGKLEKVNMPELKDAIWKGNKSAKVSLVEFSDFECPYCSKFAPTIDKVLADYADKVKFTYYNFPLSFHANAQKAAEAFECAKEQDEELGWEMHDKLFELSAQSKLNVENGKKAASELGLK